MGYNENLALLYNESNNKRDKEKIFLQLKENLHERTTKIINFWIKRFSKSSEKFDDYQTYRQVADMVLVATLNMFMGTNEKFDLEKWYTERLKNNIYDLNRDKMNINMLETLVDFQLEEVENITGAYNYLETDEDIDFKNLYDTLEAYLDKIKFRKKTGYNEDYYRKIFLDSIGFNEEKNCKSYSDIAEELGCTRQNIRDCCVRYTQQLIKLLEQDGKLELLEQYL